MLSTTDICLFVKSLRSFRTIRRLLGNIQPLTMSCGTITEEQIDCHNENNKRPIVEQTDENAPKVQKIQRIKKRNHALMLGYLGRDYYGMQRNPGTITVEEALITAIHKAELISAEEFDNIRLLHFQRAARTDKGVSAIRQVVNLLLPDEATKEAINEHLPNEIRVFGKKRVTKGFNSKSQCDARTYSYTIPTYAFAVEDIEVFAKHQESADIEERIKHLSTIDGKPYTEYRLSNESLDNLNSILKIFEGTHNFHNYTRKVKPLDPRAQRYIHKFSCTGTFVSNDMEFAVLEIKGQSFMLNQIRKMVALTIAVARNLVTKDTMKEAFGTPRYDVPIAPGLGLNLNFVHYDYYNSRYGSDGIHEALDWVECEKEVEEFKENYILKHIINTELSEKTTLNWLAGLAVHTFMSEQEVLENESTA